MIIVYILRCAKHTKLKSSFPLKNPIFLVVKLAKIHPVSIIDFTDGEKTALLFCCCFFYDNIILLRKLH